MIIYCILIFKSIAEGIDVFQSIGVILEKPVEQK